MRPSTLAQGIKRTNCIRELPDCNTGQDTDRPN